MKLILVVVDKNCVLLELFRRNWQNGNIFVCSLIGISFLHFVVYLTETIKWRLSDARKCQELLLLLKRINKARKNAENFPGIQFILYYFVSKVVRKSVISIEKNSTRSAGKLLSLRQLNEFLAN